MSLSLQNYANTINFVMQTITGTNDKSTNLNRFIDVCDMIYYIEARWKTPLKIEAIAELIHTKKLVRINCYDVNKTNGYDIIFFNDIEHPNESCGIYIKDGSRVSYDELYHMGLLGD